MGKVRVVMCTVPGCTSGEDGGPYGTDPDCSSVTERTAELKEHVYMTHTLTIDQTNARAVEASAEAAKMLAEAEKLRAEKSGSSVSADKSERKALMSRPTIEEAVSESDWSFFVAEWERYVEATGLEGDTPGAIRHLWQACSDGLRRALHNDGARSVTDLDTLLSREKSLAVQRRNNLVNIFDSTEDGSGA